MKNKSIRGFIFVFFLISGAACLAYAVIWTRMFTHVFGNTTLTVCTVLSAFMVGLALGSYYFGKLIDEKGNPLKFFAAFEIGIGIIAFLIPLFIHYSNYFYSIKYDIFGLNYFILSFAGFFISFLIMLIPTAMMGGTLPVLSKYFARKKIDLGSKIGSLYSINTFGAVIGCFLAGFYMIRTFGVNASVYLFAVINILMGISVWIMSKKEAIEESALKEEVISTLDSKNLETKNIEHIQTIEKVVLFGFALSGFCALANGVLWSRILIYIITASVYTFTIMITTFLFGLALGGYIGGKLSNRFDGIKLFSLIEVLIGFIALGTVYLLSDFLDIHNKLADMFGEEGWYKWNLIKFVETGFILFIPTLLMGSVLPIVGKVWTGNIKKVGSSIGKVYSFNIIGSVFGLIVAGFIIVPFLGIPKGIMFIAFINIIIGTTVFYLIPTIKLQIKVPITAILLALIVIQPFYIKKDKFLSLLNRFEEGSELTYFKEGISGTVTVHTYPEYYFEGKRMAIDGTNVAGTEFMLRTTQKLLGHLPLLIHGNAKKVMQIGFGSGETSNAVLLHNVDKLDMVELSEEVLKTADIYFSDMNKGIIRNKRLNPIIMDGKNYAILTKEKYDVVINYPKYPTEGACASLYTKDHFLTLSKKINENGVVSTWVPLNLTNNDFRMILETFQSVFPYSYFWNVSNSTNKHGILIGTQNRLRLDYNRFVEMMSDEKVKEDLVEVNLSNPVALLDGFLLNEKDIEALTRYALMNTDNKPLLEFSKDILLTDRIENEMENISEILKFRKIIFPYLVNVGSDEDDKNRIRTELEKYSEASKYVIVGHLAGIEGIPGIRSQGYYEALKINPDDLNAKYLLEEIEKEEINLKKKIEADSLNPKNYSEFALYYLKENKLDNSIYYLEKAIKLDPNDLDPYIGLGVVYMTLGEKDKALNMFNKAIAIDPKSSDLRYRIAYFFNDSGMNLSALREFEVAKNLNPKNADIRYGLANAYLGNKEIDKAIEEYKEAIRLNPKNANFRHSLANCYSGESLFKEALVEYREALKLDPNNPELRFNSSFTFYTLEMIDEAIYQLKQTLQLNPNYGLAYLNLGVIYESIGRLDEALGFYKKSLEVDTTLTMPYWSMGLFYYKRGMIEDAISSLKEFIKRSDNQVDIERVEKTIEEILKLKNIN